MKKNYLITFCICLTLFYCMSTTTAYADTPEAVPKPSVQPLIAHAGGDIYGLRYMNTLEALNNSYENGFRLIELDFSWTSDGYPVAIHDWSAMPLRLFKVPSKQYTLKEFLKQPTLENQTVLDLERLKTWLVEHPDAFIVTDSKKDNVLFLSYIKEHYKDIQHQFIPQIYNFESYEPILNLGYESMILTLYRLNASDEAIVEFARTHKLLAVTIPEAKGFSTLPSKLKTSGTPSYVHTINSLSTFEELNKNGVYGIYTDYFSANHWPY